MSPVEVYMPPLIYRGLNDKTYGVAGSIWIEVPSGTTLEELEDYMVYKPRKQPTEHEEKHWTVVGSKGNHYTVRLKAGQYTCTCAGFGWRRKCRHIEGIKNG